MSSEKRARQKANKAAAEAEVAKTAQGKKQRRFVIRVLVVVAIIIAVLFFNQPDPVDTEADLPITTEAPTSSS